MLCEECKKKPVARGIKGGLCFNCHGLLMTNCQYIELCDACSEKLLKCQMCGSKIGKKKADNH